MQLDYRAELEESADHPTRVGVARRTGMACAVGAALASLLMVAPSAFAATIQVDSTFDEFADPTPGGQDPGCSLREAVQAANADGNFDGCERVGGASARDTILLPGGNRYPRTRGGVDDTNSLGDLDIAGPTKIEVQGPGRATIDAHGLDRVIEVLGGGSLKASSLVITAGTVGTQANTAGGGVLVDGGRFSLRSSLVSDNGIATNVNCSCGGGLAITGGGTAKLRRVKVKQNISPDHLAGGIVPHAFR